MANFLKEDGRQYDDEEDLYSDYMDDAMDIGGEDDYLDAGGVVESFLIFGVTVSLVVLLWYRQRMQQQQQGQQQGQPGQQQQAQEQQDQQRHHLPQQPPAPAGAGAGAGGDAANVFDGLAGWAGGGMVL
ncbi:hypothetical protein E4U41_001140 [Claviceps citrina]|nr:hypothetical protein E4U41_001140 [Claviceps citrina]